MKDGTKIGIDYAWSLAAVCLALVLNWTNCACPLLEAKSKENSYSVVF